jgi:aldehyde reductase
MFTRPTLNFATYFQEGDDFLPNDSSGKVIYSDADYVDTWKQMEECVKLGLTKSIGLSNFNSEQIQRVLDIATIKPVVNQVYISQVNRNTRIQLSCQQLPIPMGYETGFNLK